MSELVTAIVSPLGSALAVAALALLCAWRRRRRLAIALGTLALAWLWLWSMPFTSVWLRAHIEGEFPPLETSALPVAPAMVVLGGAITPAVDGRPADLGAAADRVWHAARLYREGKAPLIVVSGGSDPAVSATSEAAAMRDSLLELGVPSHAILLEASSRTTRENARFTAQLLQRRGVDQVLLVTSALHMHRALALFRDAGLHPIAAATDYEARLPSGWLQWLPNTAALDGSARGLKELAGRWVWRMT